MDPAQTREGRDAERWVGIAATVAGAAAVAVLALALAVRARTLAVTRIVVSPRRAQAFLGPQGQLPSSFRWRRNLLTPPRSQTGCSACWSFTVTDMLSDALSTSTGGGWRLGALSSQFLLSCSRVHYGCAVGASPEDVYRLPQVTQEGIPLESALPYERAVTACRVLPKDAVRVRAVPGTGADLCADTTGLPPLVREAVAERNADNMKRALIEYGPIAGTLFITQQLYDYRGGVFSAPRGARRLGGHAVLIVGYSDRPDLGPDGRHWIVKNWYGPDWGEDGGYGRIRMGRDESAIESRASVCRVQIPDFLRQAEQQTDIAASADFEH